MAGLEVLLRARQADGLDDLLGYYRNYPSCGTEPGLVVDIDRVPGFAEGRERGVEYPAFRHRRVSRTRIGLWRHDAEGEIDVPDEGPVHGRFRVCEGGNTLEAAVRVGTAIALPRHGGMILHASAVARAADRTSRTVLPEAAGDALVFAGVSGAGKSTIAQLLADGCPGVRRISDELLIVRKPGHLDGESDHPWAAYVTPFLGSAGLPHGVSLPVAGVHFLAQAPGHARRRLPLREAVRELLKHVLVYVAAADTAARVLATVSGLLAEVPAYRLEFAKDLGVAEVLGIT